MKYPSHFLLASLLTSALLTISGISTAAPKLPQEQQHVSKHDNEVILHENSSQQANLKIEAVSEIIAPSTEPLNGKITFDENYTSRITTPISGRVLKINVQIGDHVKIGQALIQIDSPDLGSAIADYRKTHADLELKRKALERSQMLLEGGVIAHKEFELAQNDLAQAQAETERAKARLHNLNIDNSNTGNETFTLRAPMAGIVVDRQINVGNEVHPDLANPIFIITNPDHLWASIDLSEKDLSKVTVGQTLSIKVDAFPNEEFFGKVQSIGTMVDPVTRRIQVRCSVDSKNKLKPEMYARITPLNANKQKVIRLPNSALITEGLYSYVFVETSPNHIQKRRVTLDLQERDFATVKEGLHAGERVVTKGAILINSELTVAK